MIFLASQAEEARTRGTPVTVESFKAWKVQFDKELAMKKAKEEEEKTKGLTPKEREEWKRIGTRLSGMCCRKKGDDDNRSIVSFQGGSCSNAIRTWKKTLYWRKVLCLWILANMNAPRSRKRKTRTVSPSAIAIELFGLNICINAFYQGSTSVYIVNLTFHSPMHKSIRQRP